MEFKKNKNNRVSLFLSILILGCFIFGWVLLVTLDKVENVTFEQWAFSTYTVFTQFGFLMFSFLISSSVNKEYGSKTILFYKLLGYNSLKFLMGKISVLIIEIAVILAIGLGFVGLIFGSFNQLMLLWFLFLAVISQHIIIISLISYLCPSMVTSIGISLSYWLFSVIMSSFGGVFQYIALFDASNPLYENVEKTIFSNSNFLDGTSTLTIISFISVLLIASTIVSALTGKRWLKLGLQNN